MNRLQAELQRLFLANEIDPDAAVRAMVLELARPASWEGLSNVWRGVQVDLELPAPAIAVSGIDGYQLWFSLSEPVPVAQAMGFLESLRSRYLGDVARDRIAMQPARDARLPAVQQGEGRWSAFVAPDLAAVFGDEPWLDLPPGADAQADLLSRLACTKPDEWKRAIERLVRVHAAAPDAAPGGARLPEAGPAADPRRFLLGIMHDGAVDLHLRIEAAKALLPYFESERPR
ncbi:MAG: hypothetical protein NVS3B2_17890 [Ramlibacter sp.]